MTGTGEHPAPETRIALVLAANASAVATWVVTWTGRVVAAAYEGVEPGSIDELAGPFAQADLRPRYVVALVVALAAAVVAVALGIRWLRRGRRGLLPALSLAHAVLAWVVLAALVVAGAWQAP